MKIRPLHDRVLVRRVEELTKTSGGIIIPDTAKEKPLEGIVEAVGTGKIAFALIYRLAAAGTGADHLFIGGEQLLSVLGDMGIGRYGILYHSADTIKELTRIGFTSCNRG